MAILRGTDSRDRERSGAFSQSLSSDTIGDSLTVTLWTAVSRLTGLAKFVAIGAVLGPTFLGNTYQAANDIPNIVYYGLLAGSLLPSLLVPPLVHHLDANNHDAAERLAGSFMRVAFIVLCVVTLVLTLVGPAIVRILSVGVPDAGVAAAQRRVGWLLLAMFMPQVVLYGIAGTAGAVMQAHRRFTLPAAAPALENLAMVALLVATAAVFGTGTDVRDVQSTQVLLLGVGTTAAVGAHAWTQWWGARRLGFSLLRTAARGNGELREVLSRAVPSLGHAGLAALQSFAVVVVANAVAGGVVAFHLAQSFCALVVAVWANPVALTLLPQLSRLHSSGDVQRFRDELVRGLRMAFFLAFPAAFAYAVLARPLAHAISFGEMAQARGVTFLSASLVALAPAVVAETGFTLLTYASYARRDSRSPFLAMIVRAAVSLATMPLAFAFRDRGLLTVLGLSISLSVLAGTLFLARRVVRGLPPRGEPLLSPLARHAVAGALMLGPAHLVAVRLPQFLSGQLANLLGMMVATAVGLGSYLLAQRAMRASELSALAGVARPLFSRN